MAITARFQADFSSFTAAVDKAEVELRSFESQAGKVEKSLGRMGNSLSGTKLIQDATLMAAAIEKVGGTSALTERELQRVAAQAKEATEKMRALGLGVPENLQKIADAAKPAQSGITSIVGSIKNLAAVAGIGFGVQQVIGFGRAILDDADALVKMSDRTGISISGLQRLQAAGDDAGNSIEEMSGAVNRLQDNIAGGNKSAVAAMERLQIDLTQFKNLNPENQFIAISDAIRQIKDPAEQVTIAVDLFGKQGLAVLPTLKRGFDDLKDSAVGMSEETARELDAIGDEFSRLARQVKGFAAEASVAIWHWAEGPLVTASNQIKVMREELERMTDRIKEAPKPFAPYGQLPTSPSSAFNPAVEREYAALEAKLRATRDLVPTTKRAIDAEDEFKKSIENATIAMNLSVFTLHRFGATELPAVQTGIAGLDTTIDHLDSQTLADLKIKLQDVGHAGVAAAEETKGAWAGLEDFFANDLGDLIVGAFQGGGDVGKTIGAAIGKEIGEGLEEALSKVLSKIPLGEMLGSFLGPLGALGGSLLGKGIEALFHIGGPSRAELAGREVEAAFEQGFGGFDAMMAKIGEAYATVGLTSQQAQDDVARLLAAEKQGGDAVQRVIDEITAHLDEAKRHQEELNDAVEDSGKAAEKAAQKTNAVIDGMMSKRDSLASSIADEADEAVKGSIQLGIEAQIASLDAQIAQQKAALERQADEAAQDLEDKLNDINPDDITIRVHWDIERPPRDWYQGSERPEPIPMANGGDFMVRKPTLFLAGEAGPERATFTPLGKGGSSSPRIVQLMLDRRVLAEVHIDNLLRDEAGIRRATKKAAA